MMKGFVTFGLLAGLTALIIIMAGILAAPPRFIAHATFTINWDKIATDNQDANNKFTRAAFDKSLLHIQISDEFVSILGDECKIPDSQRNILAQKIRRNLKVKRVGVAEGADLYRASFMDNNRDVALKCINLLSTRLVDRFNARAKLKSALNAGKSIGDNLDTDTDENELSKELGELNLQQNQEYSPARAAQIQEIKDKLNQADLNKGVTAIQTLVGIVGVFSNPATDRQDGVVRENHGLKVRTLVLKAFAGGVGTGLAGMVAIKFLFTPKKRVPPLLQSAAEPKV